MVELAFSTNAYSTTLPPSLVDAAVASVAGLVWGLAALAILVSAVGLARAFDVT